VKIPTFKTVITYTAIFISIVIALGVIAYSVNFVFDSFKTSKQVDNLIKTNATLRSQIDVFTISERAAKEEKAKLLLDLSKKEVLVIEKEKIIYKDGQLIVPPDYDTLKADYLILGDNYKLVKAMYEALLQQSQKDSDTIDTAMKKIDDLNTQNTNLLDQLKKPVKKELFSQSVLFGVGVNIDNTLSYNLGYQITLLQKFQGQVILTYPARATVMLGVRL